MPHFAKLDKNSVVTFVTVGSDHDDGKELELSKRTKHTYKQTSYNTQGGVHLLGGNPFRKNFAGIGFTYDADLDAFIPPKPYPSWLLDEESATWKAPVAYPEGEVMYSWNEGLGDWESVQFEVAQ